MIHIFFLTLVICTVLYIFFLSTMFVSPGADGEECGQGEYDSANDPDSPPSRWRRFRVSAAQTCQVLLGGPLEEWEKEMFLFPRCCRRCRSARRDGMSDCADCMCVSYCSEQCRREDSADHRGRRCQELRFAMACDNFECSVNVAAPALPSELDRSYRPLPADVERYLTQAVGAGERQLGGLAMMERKFLTDRVSGPLSVVHAAQKHGLARGREIGKVWRENTHTHTILLAAAGHVSASLSWKSSLCTLWARTSWRCSA